MSKIKGKNTLPEITVRKFLFSKGLRYRLHLKSLAGKPDIVIPKSKVIVFINGCFWHQHKNCKRSSIPKSNSTYWIPKLERNIQKQKEDIKQLKLEGWDIIVLWECEIKSGKFVKKIEKKIWGTK